MRAADLGLSIDLYQPFRDFEAVPADVLGRNLRRAERKFDVMERLGVVTCCCVCSSVSPDAVDDDALAAEQLRLARRAGRRPRHQDRLRGAGLGPPRQRVPARLANRRGWPIIQLSASASTASTSCRVVPTPGASRRSPATRSSSSSWPTRRCLAHGRPAVEPPLPMFPRAGWLRPGRSGGARPATPDTPGRCRWRCSTTFSGRPTPPAPPWTPCGR